VPETFDGDACGPERMQPPPLPPRAARAPLDSPESVSRKRPAERGVRAIRPSLPAVDAATPRVTRADIEQYVASHGFSIGSLCAPSVTLVDVHWGSQPELEALLPDRAKLVDMPRLLCMAETRGSVRVHQGPGTPPAEASRLFVVFDAAEVVG
jgi:hypothetical protein